MCSILRDGNKDPCVRICHSINMKEAYLKYEKWHKLRYNKDLWVIV